MKLICLFLTVFMLNKTDLLYNNPIEDNIEAETSQEQQGDYDVSPLCDDELKVFLLD